MQQIYVHKLEKIRFMIRFIRPEVLTNIDTVNLQALTCLVTDRNRIQKIVPLPCAPLSFLRSQLTFSENFRFTAIITSEGALDSRQFCSNNRSTIMVKTLNQEVFFDFCYQTKTSFQDMTFEFMNGVFMLEKI